MRFFEEQMDVVVDDEQVDAASSEMEAAASDERDGRCCWQRGRLTLLQVLLFRARRCH